MQSAFQYRPAPTIVEEDPYALQHTERVLHHRGGLAVGHVTENIRTIGSWQIQGDPEVHCLTGLGLTKFSSCTLRSLLSWH